MAVQEFELRANKIVLLHPPPRAWSSRSRVTPRCWTVLRRISMPGAAPRVRSVPLGPSRQPQRGAVFCMSFLVVLRRRCLRAASGKSGGRARRPVASAAREVRKSRLVAEEHQDARLRRRDAVLKGLEVVVYSGSHGKSFCGLRRGCWIGSGSFWLRHPSCPRRPRGLRAWLGSAPAEAFDDHEEIAGRRAGFGPAT